MLLKSRGTYCLLISCKNTTYIQIGKLGSIEFKPGFYLYIGSALNNINKRITRHLLRDKKKFWHIDYITSDKNFEINRIYIIDKLLRLECGKARIIGKKFSSINGFGSSDCRCKGHLFSAGDKKSIAEIDRIIIGKAGFAIFDKCSLL